MTGRKSLGRASRLASLLGAAAMLGGVALLNVTCGGAEEAFADPSGDEAGTVDDGSTTVQGELSRRGGWRGWRTTTQRPAGTTSTDGGSGAGNGTTSTPPGGATNPPSGVVDASNSGGRCPDNRPMPEGGPCGPYGITCTYDDATSHLCICLNASSSGSQGWTCR